MARTRNESGTYRIELDKEWLLTEFYEFPHVYFQIYSVIACIEGLEGSTVDAERVQRAFESYPWRGGYSAVNFYKDLYRSLPTSARPRVVAIQYSSPGFIDLALWTVVALSIRRIMKAFLDLAEQANAVYSQIYREMQQRKLLNLDVKKRELELSEAQLAFIRRATFQLSQILRLPDASAVRNLPLNELALLKIQLSLFRRIRSLAKYIVNGKIKL